MEIKKIALAASLLAMSFGVCAADFVITKVGKDNEAKYNCGTYSIIDMPSGVVASTVYEGYKNCIISLVHSSKISLKGKSVSILRRTPFNDGTYKFEEVDTLLIE